MSILSSIARQMSDDDLAIAWRIRQFRYKRGLSQTDVAARLGVSFQQFQKYEQGRNRISAARLVAIARILGVTPHDILQWTEIRPANSKPDGPEKPLAPLMGGSDRPTADVDKIFCDIGAAQRDVADLWYRIQSDLNALAVLSQMAPAPCGHSPLHLEIGTKSQNQLSEVEK